MRWSRYEMLWVRDGLLGTSWSGYEMVWVRIGLGTNWSAGYELTRSHLSSDIISSFLQIATETQLAERARLEQRIEDLEVSIRVVSWCTFCRLKNSEQSNPVVRIWGARSRSRAIAHLNAAQEELFLARLGPHTNKRGVRRAIFHSPTAPFAHLRRAIYRSPVIFKT